MNWKTTPEEREELRTRGQFWTPSWVAEPMASFVAEAGEGDYLDPAVGEGAFVYPLVRALKRRGQRATIRCFDTDDTLKRSYLALAEPGSTDVHYHHDDALFSGQHAVSYRGIVCNPPYMRHHRLGHDYKQKLSGLYQNITGHTLDRRAGLHVYFLVAMLARLAPSGRLSFIVSADIAEGVFAARLWNWIGERYDIEAVASFTGEASPFRGVDTNPLIINIHNRPPTPSIRWIRCSREDSEGLASALRDGVESPGFAVAEREAGELIAGGLSRPARPIAEKDAVPLKKIAHVVRGIATGANDFFLFSEEEKLASGIPPDFFRAVVARTREVEGDRYTREDWEANRRAGKRVHVLYLNGYGREALPPSVREYLEQGERLGIHERALIRQRKPWYRMEKREVPPILFAYLGRRKSRFIVNEAKALPLTGFLCVYPERPLEPEGVRQLVQALNHERTLAHLPFVGKSYGNGAIKVEPRALERLVVPRDLATDYLEDAPGGGQLEIEIG